MTRTAVVGAGIVGLAAAHALRARGADVTLYESGPPGGGQSAGQGRIFRHALTGRSMAVREGSHAERLVVADPGWSEVEAEKPEPRRKPVKKKSDDE